MTAEGGVLRRIARPAPPPEPVTPGRALRLAVARAADQAAGLALAGLGVADEVAPLDALLARLEPDLMLLGIERGGLAGLLGLDGEARAALVEAQTLGHPLAHPADPRSASAADEALCGPFADAFLGEAEGATRGTSLAGWIGTARVGAAIDSARDAGLALPDGSYRAVRLTLDLGAGGRQGLLVLVLPVALRAPEGPSRAALDWRRGLGAQVMAAPAPVTAVLHRLRLTLAVADGLAAGQVIPLPGVTVGSVRLEGPGGMPVALARLGQVAGMRAVRIEAPLTPVLQDIAPPPALAPPT